MAFKDPTKRKAYRLDHLEQTKQYNKQYRLENAEKLALKRRATAEQTNARSKQWAKDNPDKRRNNKLSHSFWTLEMYEQANTAQEGRCAICNEVSSETLHADHDHVTQKPRALLCRKHNMMLGLVNDSPEILEAAAAYLRKWRN